MSESPFSSYQSEWLRGVETFNEGRFYDAHHFWEQGWTRLKTPAHEWIQSLILVCGAAVHFEKGKPEPALRLIELAIERIEAVEMLGSPLPEPHPEIPGLIEALLAMRAEWKAHAGVATSSVAGSSLQNEAQFCANGLSRCRALRARMSDSWRT